MDSADSRFNGSRSCLNRTSRNDQYPGGRGNGNVGICRTVRGLCGNVTELFRCLYSNNDRRNALYRARPFNIAFRFDNEKTQMGKARRHETL